MIFEIYSFGDVITLNQIFNAISIIFQDSGYTAATVAVLTFMTIGMTIANFVGGGKELPYGQLFAGMLLFGMGFGTYTSVSIENRYTSVVTQIDNIPIAIAAPASLISGIGFWITEKTETAFANLDSQKITENGYLSPLKTIANLRRATYFENCPAGMTASTGAYNLCYSLRSYMADCAMVKVARDNHSVAMRKGNIIDEINFNSSAYSTSLVRADGSSEYTSCKNAYTQIFNDLENNHNDMLNTMIAQIGIRVGENGIDRMSDAMEAIGADKSKAKEFAYSLFLDKNAADGTLDYLHKVGASDLAENYSSSIQQRNYEWSLQANMFTQILGQFLSLMEAVIFAIAPFIGLMALTGPTGMKSLMLYVQMMLVINFIPPMLVIVQNITLADVANYAKSLELQGMVIGSLDYMNLLTKKTNEMMGVGGMVATTIVPALAMAIVSGSGMAVMGAMRGIAAAPKDTDAVSQHVDQGGVKNLGNMTNSDIDRYNNAWTQQSSSSVMDITDSTQLTSSVNSAKVESEKANAKWSETSSNIIQSMDQAGFKTTDAHSVSDKVMNSSTKAQEWGTTTATSLEQNNNLTEAGSEAFSGALAFSAATGIELGELFKMGASGELKGAFADTLTQEDQERVSKMIQNGTAEKIAQSFTTTLETGGVDTSTIDTGNQYVEAHKNETQNAREAARSSEQKYEKAEEIKKSLKLEDTDNEGLIHRIANANDGAAAKYIDDQIATMNENGNPDAALYYSYLEDYTSQSGTNLDEETAKFAAYSAMLKDTNNGDDLFGAIEASGYYEKDGNSMGDFNSSTLEIPDGTGTESYKPEETLLTEEMEGNAINAQTLSSETPVNEVPTSHSGKFTEEAMKRQNIEAEATQLLQAYSDANTMQGEASEQIEQAQERLTKDILENNIAYQAANGIKETMTGYLSGEVSEKGVYEAIKEGLGVNFIDSILKDANESYFKTMIGEQHALLSGQTPNWTPDEKTAKDIEHLRYEADKAGRLIGVNEDLVEKASSPNTREQAADDLIDNKARFAHYQEQLKLAESGQEYTTSFNSNPSEEPSYIDRKILEQEQQRASEGISVLQYNARSENATEADKEAYDSALSKILFTTQQIENIDNGQAYQTKESGPTYSASSLQQQSEHLMELKGQLNAINNAQPEPSGEMNFNQQQVDNINAGQPYQLEKDGISYTSSPDHADELANIIAQQNSLGIKDDFYQNQFDNLISGNEYQLQKDGEIYQHISQEQQSEHFSTLEQRTINEQPTMNDEDREWIMEQINNMQSGMEYKLDKNSDDTYKGIFVPFDVPK